MQNVGTDQEGLMILFDMGNLVFPGPVRQSVLSTFSVMLPENVPEILSKEPLGGQGTAGEQGTASEQGTAGEQGDHR